MLALSCLSDPDDRRFVSTCAYGQTVAGRSIRPISFADITPELARESGFNGVIDLLKIAKHGKGENVYLVRFHYVPPRRKRAAPR